MNKGVSRGASSYLAVAGLFLGVVAAVIFSSAALAISSTGPDSDISNSNPRFVLVNSPNTGNMSYSEVPIYFSKALFDQGGELKIKFKDFACENGGCNSSSSSRNQFVGLSYGAGGSLASPVTNSRVNSTTTFTLNRNKFSIAPGTNDQYMRTVIKMNLRNGNNGSDSNSFYRNRIMFRISVSPDSGYVGSAVGASSSYVNLVANSPNGGGVYSYSIPFASPCNLTDGSTGTIRLYDLDSNDPDNGGKIVTVRIKNMNTGNWVSGSNIERSGSMGDDSVYSLKLTFKKDAKYMLVLSNIHAMNMVQYKLPEDDIAYKVDCSPPEAESGAVNLLTSALVSGSENSPNPIPSPEKSNSAGWSTSNNITAVPGNYIYFRNSVKERLGAVVYVDRYRQRMVSNLNGDDVNCSGIPYAVGKWSRYDDSDCLWSGTLSANSKREANSEEWFPGEKKHRLWWDGNGAISDWHAGRSLCERYLTVNKVKGESGSWSPIAGTNKNSRWRCVDVLDWGVDVQTQIRAVRGGSADDWAESNISDARPGSTIQFQHELYGTKATKSPALSGVEYISYTQPDWRSAVSIESISPRTSRVISGGQSKVILASDAGRSFCSQYRINRGTNTYGNNSPATSDRVCAYVPYNYNLTPKINATAAGLEAGTVVDLNFINASVYAETTNAGNAATNSKPNVGYKLEYYVKGGTNKIELTSGSISGGIAPGSSTLSSVVGPSFQLPDVLDKDVCFVFTIGNVGRGSSFAAVTDDRDTTPSKSAESCVRLGKKPKVAITGGDVIVGRNTPGSDVYGSTTTYPSKDSTNPKKTATTGSWSEYAIFASGVVDSFGSAGGFANRRDTSSGSTLTNLKVGIGGLVDVCQYGVMTFTDVGLRPSGSANPTDVECPGNGGNYEVKSAARPISTMLRPTTVNMSAWDPNSTGITSRLYTGNQTFSANNVKGTVILAVNGNVTINGNITLDDNTLKAAYASGNFAAIPQVVIIASGNITINSNVTRVDAWLITDGANSEVQTCNLLGRSLSECNQQLIVNGPVATNTLRLRRTAGADLSSSNDWGSRPAEVFNLRADAYLWARGYGESLTSPVRTTFVEELPPRL